MLRFFCATNYCGLLDAQHCRDRQVIATLEGERDAAVAQAAALAEDNARLRAELEKAREGTAFYMGLYCDAAAKLRRGEQAAVAASDGVALRELVTGKTVKGEVTR